MTKYEFKLWWCVIPANLAATCTSMLVAITIPFGLWRSFSPFTFISMLVVLNVIIWLCTFTYYYTHEDE